MVLNNIKDVSERIALVHPSPKSQMLWMLLGHPSLETGNKNEGIFC
jgi:hypothetical protein